MAGPTGDGDGWVGVAGLFAPVVTFVVGVLGTAFVKGMRWANAEGRNDGSVATWRAAIEARISAIEARKDRMDERLDTFGTKADMKERFDAAKTEMERRFDRLERRLEISDAHMMSKTVPHNWGGT